MPIRANMLKGRPRVELRLSNESITSTLRLIIHFSLPWSRWPYNLLSIFMTEGIGEDVWAHAIFQHYAIL